MACLEKHIGERFGRLTIIGVRCRRGSKTKMICECDCGNIVEVYYYNMTRGVTASCGCLHRERASASAITHSMSKTRFYKIYRDMVRRCSNVSRKSYVDYGGRGIQVEWDNFEEFMSDMYESYQKHIKEFGEKETTLDRIDVDGNYCKENCRWTTNLVQANNTRRNHYITIGGITKTASEWSREYGIVDYHTFLDRINKFGWEPMKALTTPPKPVGNNVHKKD